MLLAHGSRTCNRQLHGRTQPVISRRGTPPLFRAQFYASSTFPPNRPTPLASLCRPSHFRIPFIYVPFPVFFFRSPCFYDSRNFAWKTAINSRLERVCTKPGRQNVFRCLSVKSDLADIRLIFYVQSRKVRIGKSTILCHV